MPCTGPDDAATTSPPLLADLDAGVLTLTLNRPAQRNALNVALTLALVELLQAVRHDAQVRVLVLRGAGAGFSAGLDHEDFEHDDGTPQRSGPALRAARLAADELGSRGLAQLPQPVIAMVHGHCEGAALALLAGCDIVFTAHDARFALPDVDAARMPGGSVEQALSRVMAPRAARWHALSGQPFDGLEAERNGLATRSFAPDELARETRALATELAAKDALALQFTKESLRHVAGLDWDAVLSYHAAKSAELKALQAGRPSARAAAVESFLAGKSKPGLGA